MARSSEFPAGALIRGVVDSSPAARAGIKVNDVITRIGGEALGQTNSLARVVRHHQPGDKVDLEVWRNGNNITLSVTLGTVE